MGCVARLVYPYAPFHQPQCQKFASCSYVHHRQQHTSFAGEYPVHRELAVFVGTLVRTPAPARESTCFKQHRCDLTFGLTTLLPMVCCVVTRARVICWSQAFEFDYHDLVPGAQWLIFTFRSPSIGLPMPLFSDSNCCSVH